MTDEQVKKIETIIDKMLWKYLLSREDARDFVKQAVIAHQGTPQDIEDAMAEFDFKHPVSTDSRPDKGFPDTTVEVQYKGPAKESPQKKARMKKGQVSANQTAFVK